jgi:hypothetical protein
MPGRGALLDISAAKADISSTRMHENDTGVSGSDTSAIGGSGRKGASGHGSLDEPTFLNVAEKLKSGHGGMGDSGQMGYDSGAGMTFGNKVDKI